MRTRLRACEDGAALLEAALVLPILLLLVLGLTDICLYFWNAALVGKAAQLGARRAIVSDPVAIGPGLDAADAVTFWGTLPPGSRCYGSSGEQRGCPDFTVVCDAAACRCTGSACGFRLAATRLAPIVGAMRGVLPDVTVGNVEIAYATNGLGYVARPGPVPVDVRVTLKGLAYRPFFLQAVLGDVVPLAASVRLPSESLTSRP